jgi:hypothetical protein
VPTRHTTPDPERIFSIVTNGLKPGLPGTIPLFLKRRHCHIRVIDISDRSIRSNHYRGASQ